ncbi:MAG: hypothetical protein ABIG93_03470 [archaeon]|nr:hypothetical protein [Nanoarchaeota archaeon]
MNQIPENLTFDEMVDRVVRFYDQEERSRAASVLYANSHFFEEKGLKEGFLRYQFNQFVDRIRSGKKHKFRVSFQQPEKRYDGRSVYTSNFLEGVPNKDKKGSPNLQQGNRSFGNLDLCEILNLQNSTFNHMRRVMKDGFDLIMPPVVMTYGTLDEFERPLSYEQKEDIK